MVGGGGGMEREEGGENHVVPIANKEKIYSKINIISICLKNIIIFSSWSKFIYISQKK